MLCFPGMPLAISSLAAPVAAFEVKDSFGRTLNLAGLTLVDWEGQIANPAIQFFIKPPPGVGFPASATLTTSGARLYFDVPSDVGSNGPSKTISFSSAASQVPVFISIFPDRDTLNEEYTLTIRLNATGAQTNIPIHVIDQDTTLTNLFNVIVDFSEDQTGFFADPLKRSIVEQAARDWAYFIGDMQLAMVPAGAEQTFIWDTNGFVSGRYINNATAYRGYLLYAYGIHSDELRSGGAGSYAGDLQRSNNVALPIKRSGSYEAEIAGNYNELGWFLTTSDEDWWQTENLGHEANDLYSIAHHEIGHALFFNPAHPRFEQHKTLGMVTNAAVVAYHGSAPQIDNFDHFDGEIDNASLRGAFGYEYFGSVPRRRWLLTKLDLLNAQAMGYALRPTSVLAPLAWGSNSLASGAVTVLYQHRLSVMGGIPFYFFEVVSGALPPGLELDSFTGAITGMPLTNGVFEFMVRVRDYNTASAGLSLPVRLMIGEAPAFEFVRGHTARSNGVFHARLSGASGQVQVIEVSSNFLDWSPLMTNSSGASLFDFLDTKADGHNHRFYRAKSPP